MILTLLALVTIQGPLLAVADKALQFGATASDYMKYYPNMAPFANAFSACTWVMKGRVPPSVWHAPIILDYHTNPVHNIHELLMTDNGGFNRLFNGMQFDGNLGSSFSAPVGMWFHYCVTWSSASNMQRIYYNGAQVGVAAMPAGSTLTPGGVATMGNRRDIHSYYPFGGKISKFNIFSKEMSGDEVKAMSDAGVCSSIEKQRFGDVRSLTWEYILDQPKTGNVVAQDVGTCADQEMKDEIERLQKELDDAKKALEDYKAACEEAKDSLRDELNSTRAAAAEREGQLEKEIDSLKEQLAEAVKEQCPGEGIWTVPEKAIGKKVNKRQLKKWKKAGETDLVRYLSDWKGARLTKKIVKYIECFETV
ncbi:hypothetical protein ACHWQZ_G016158 [Mnemiopsis leidyi]